MTTASVLVATNVSMIGRCNGVPLLLLLLGEMIVLMRDPVIAKAQSKGRSEAEGDAIRPSGGDDERAHTLIFSRFGLPSDDEKCLLP
jgi:hypothetical protein